MRKDRLYECDCPYCRNKIYVRKSILQEIHMTEEGFGRCVFCDNRVNLVYDQGNDSMNARTILQHYDVRNLQFPMAVVYHRPADMPDCEYVIRIHECIPIPRETEMCSYHDNLENARKDLKAAGFRNNLGRTNEDDPVIVESWVF